MYKLWQWVTEGWSGLSTPTKFLLGMMLFTVYLSLLGVIAEQ